MLQVLEEFHFRNVRHAFVFGKNRQDGISFFRRRVHVGLAVVVAAHAVNQRQTFLPGSLLIFVLGLAHSLVDKVGDSGVFGSARMAILGNDRLSQFVD